MSDEYKPDFGSDDRNDWSDDGADDENNEASHDAQNFSQISDTNHNPPPNTIMNTSKRKVNVSVIPARLNAPASAKTSMA